MKTTTALRMRGEAWNVIAALALLMAIGVMMAMAGCGEPPTTLSPFSGAPATAPEIVAQAQAAEQEKELAAAAAEREARTKLLALESRARTEAARLSAASKISAAEQESRAAEIEAELSTAAGEVMELRAGAIERLTTERLAIGPAVEASLADLTRQAEQRAAAWGVLKPIVMLGAGAVGGPAAGGAVNALDPLVTLWGGAGTIAAIAAAWRARKNGQAARAARDETTTLRRDAERVVDSIDVLIEKEPAVRAAIESNRTLLDKWQGESGRKLVDALQM